MNVSSTDRSFTTIPNNSIHNHSDSRTPELQGISKYLAAINPIKLPTTGLGLAVRATMVAAPAATAAAAITLYRHDIFSFMETMVNTIAQTGEGLFSSIVGAGAGAALVASGGVLALNGLRLNVIASDTRFNKAFVGTREFLETIQSKEKIELDSRGKGFVIKDKSIENKVAYTTSRRFLPMFNTRNVTYGQIIEKINKKVNAETPNPRIKLCNAAAEIIKSDLRQAQKAKGMQAAFSYAVGGGLLGSIVPGVGHTIGALAGIILGIGSYTLAINSLNPLFNEIDIAFNSLNPERIAKERVSHQLESTVSENVFSYISKQVEFIDPLNKSNTQSETSIISTISSSLDLALASLPRNKKHDALKLMFKKITGILNTKHKLISRSTKLSLLYLKAKIIDESLKMRQTKAKDSGCHEHQTGENPLQILNTLTSTQAEMDKIHSVFKESNTAEINQNLKNYLMNYIKLGFDQLEKMSQDWSSDPNPQELKKLQDQFQNVKSALTDSKTEVKITTSSSKPIGKDDDFITEQFSLAPGSGTIVAALSNDILDTLKHDDFITTNISGDNNECWHRAAWKTILDRKSPTEISERVRNVFKDENELSDKTFDTTYEFNKLKSDPTQGFKLGEPEMENKFFEIFTDIALQDDSENLIKQNEMQNFEAIEKLSSVFDLPVVCLQNSVRDVQPAIFQTNFEDLSNKDFNNKWLAISTIKDPIQQHTNIINFLKENQIPLVVLKDSHFTLLTPKKAPSI